MKELRTTQISIRLTDSERKKNKGICQRFNDDRSRVHSEQSSGQRS